MIYALKVTEYDIYSNTDVIEVGNNIIGYTSNLEIAKKIKAKYDTKSLLSADIIEIEELTYKE